LLVAIYARKSTDQNGTAEAEKSVTRQVDQARAFASSRGWSVAEDYIFVDDGISGAEFAKRPGLMRLLDSLKPHPPFTVLVMSHVDRLGREQIETSYFLKLINIAGVRVFDYLEGRERLLESPTDKLLLSVHTFAAEMERDQARKRTRDALLAKARKGFVTGGNVFGYDNIEISDEAGRRQHVIRHINADEAAIIHRIFKSVASDMGLKKIAKVLNAEAVPAPRPRRAGRPRSWSASSIRWILFNPLYAGRIVWGRVRKRNSWGQKQQNRRPQTDWVELPPRDDLRIVSDEMWQAAHAAITMRKIAYNARGGFGGRPRGGTESKYLLTGFAECADCGGSMVAGSRASGSRRQHAYVCANHRERGNTICSNRLHAPMDDTDAAVLATIERDLMTSDVVEAAVAEASRLLLTSPDEARIRQADLEEGLRTVEGELARYAEAIASAGSLDVILVAIKERETRRMQLRSELGQLHNQASAVPSLDASRLNHDLLERLSDWKGLLRRHTSEARQILRRLLVGRLAFRPRTGEGARYYEFRGEGSLSGILTGIVATEGLVAPTGFEPVFQP
jgi:site-specific DNA recombinase